MATVTVVRAGTIEYPERREFVTERRPEPPGEVTFMPTSVYEWTRRLNGTYATFFYLFGSLVCGRKVCIVCTQVPIWTTVAVPAGVSVADFRRVLRNVATSDKMYLAGMNECRLLPFKGFRTEPADWIRVSFNTSYDRKKFIDYCDFSGKTDIPRYEIVDDDDTLYPMVARTLGFPTGKWCRCIGAAETDPTQVDVRNVDSVWTVPMSGLKPSTWPDVDRTLLVTWDIETHSVTLTGDAPGPKDQFVIISIGATAHFKETSETLVTWCGSIMETSAHPKQAIGLRNYIAICGTERELIAEYIRFLLAIRPDVLQAFNGGGYDWPLLREKCATYRLLDDLYNALSCVMRPETDVYKHCFKREKVKISPEERATMLSAQFPGVLDTDTMVVFKQEYPTAEVGRGQSLNHYLKLNGLESKEDMYYKRLHRIYELSREVQACRCETGVCPFRAIIGEYYTKWVESPSEQIPLTVGSCRDHVKIQVSLLLYYNTIDCLRTQQLFSVRTVISDRRAFADYSFTSVYDAFYRANGVKVQNLVGHYCAANGFAYSNRSSKTSVKHKYPGAIVFKPEKGLHNEDPTTALDASSLYPSEQRAFNISPDKTVIVKSDTTVDPEQIVKGRNEVQRLLSIGYTLAKINFKTLSGVEVEAYTVRHNGNHTLSHIGQTIVDGYERVDGKFTKRPDGSRVPRRGRPCLPGESMGIMPYFLDILFRVRAGIKKRFGPLTKLRERYAKLKEANGSRDPMTYLTPKDFEGTLLLIGSSYELVDTTWAKVNSDQKAVKILMNTVYGASGNYKSPLYMLPVAGGTTMFGRDTITEVYRYCTELGFRVRYGDSVTGETPIPILHSSRVKYVKISDLTSNWFPRPDGKETAQVSCRVWCESGWTPILRVVRHRTTKMIFRVTTGKGSVCVTEDHSLLDWRARKVAPRDLTIFSRLLHAKLPIEDAVWWCDLTSLHASRLNRWLSNREGQISFATETELEAANLVLALDSYGVPNVYREGVVTAGVGGSDHVEKVEYLGVTNDYVYDLETATHHFAAGVGRLVVHNTDSNYLGCPERLFGVVKTLHKHHVAYLETVRQHLGLEPGPHPKCYVDSDRVAVSDLYRSVDTAWTQKLRAGTPHHCYQEDETAWTEAVRWLETAPSESRLEALRSREREDYWTKMVQITRAEIERLRVDVNDRLVEFTGTEYISMAYEEVLHPAVLTGKKKYFGFAHLANENFHPRDSDLFVKGVDIIKQGQTQLAKDYGYSTIQEILSVDNYRGILDIIHDKLRDLVTRKFDTSVFVKQSKYKLPRDDKPGNVTVQRFIKRMRETKARYERAGDHSRAALYAIPDVGDRFKYVVVEHPVEYDYRGNKIDKSSVAEKMEFLTVYEASQGELKIDFSYYMESAVFGIFARFISYIPEFEPAGNYDLDDKDEYKIYDTKLIGAAKKYIGEYCEWLTAGAAKPVVADGTRFKRLYRHIRSVVAARSAELYGGLASYYLYWLDWEELPQSTIVFPGRDPFEFRILSSLFEMAFTPVRKSKPVDIVTAQRIVMNMLKPRILRLEDQVVSLIRDLNDVTKRVRDSLAGFTIYMRRCREWNDDAFDREVNETALLSSEELETVKTFVELATRLVALYSLRNTYARSMGSL